MTESLSDSAVTDDDGICESDDKFEGENVSLSGVNISLMCC